MLFHGNPNDTPTPQKKELLLIDGSEIGWPPGTLNISETSTTLTTRNVFGFVTCVMEATVHEFGKFKTIVPIPCLIMKMKMNIIWMMMMMTTTKMTAMGDEWPSLEVMIRKCLPTLCTLVCVGWKIPDSPLPRRLVYPLKGTAHSIWKDATLKSHTFFKHHFLGWDGSVGVRECTVYIYIYIQIMYRFFDFHIYHSKTFNRSPQLRWVGGVTQVAWNRGGLRAPPASPQITISPG